jgi:glycosyltransferase involved in cell wall biosynthesis
VSGGVERPHNGSAPGPARHVLAATAAHMELKVLHIIPALRQGGAEKLLFDLVSSGRAAAKMNVVTLLAEEPFFRFDAKAVQTLGMRPGWLSPRALARLRRKIKEFNPHVIHAWLYYGNLSSIAAGGLGIPIIWSIHNTTLSTEHSKLFTRWANRICARLSSRIPARIVYCAKTARHVHERIGYDASRGIVIENGIDVAAFAFDPDARRRIREAVGLAEEDYAVGCIARFDPQKNHPLVIEAFSKVCMGEKAKLLLVGRGCTADNEQLVQWLKTFGVEDRVKLLGERHDMPAVMSALDVLVSASTYGEALPLTAIEAAAIGLPIVTTDVGDIAGLVLDPADVVSPVTADAMATAIRNVRDRRSRPELEYRKRDRLSGVVRDFSLANTVEQYHEVYRSLAQAVAPARRVE